MKTKGPVMVLESIDSLFYDNDNRRINLGSKEIMTPSKERQRVDGPLHFVCEAKAQVFLRPSDSNDLAS